MALSKKKCTSSAFARIEFLIKLIKKFEKNWAPFAHHIFPGPKKNVYMKFMI